MIDETMKRFKRLVLATGAADESVLSRAERSEGFLPTVLVTEFGCDRTRVRQVLSEVYRVPGVDVRGESIDADLLKHARTAFWQRHRALPLREEDGHAVVALADPEDLAAVDEVRLALGNPLKPCVAMEDEIRGFLDDFSGRKSVDGLVTELVRKFEESPKPQRPAGPRLRETSESEARNPAVQLIDAVVADAVARGARQVYLVPMPDGRVHVRMQVDRKLVERKSYLQEMHPRVVNRLRVLTDLVGKDKRVPQSGAYLTPVGDKTHRVDVMILPGDSGDTVTLMVDQSPWEGNISE